MSRIPHPLVLLSLAGLLSLQGAAQAADQPAEQRQIVVTGEAQVSAAPDMAILTIGVLKTAATARQALDADNQALSAVIAGFKNAGVAEKDLQTANFSISPQFDYSDKSAGQPKLVGYQVSNTLNVRVRDLNTLGKLLDNAVSSGMNSAGSLSFVNSNMDELMGKARQQAIRNALTKAKEMAEAAGVNVGDVLSISESQPAEPFRPVMRLAAAKQSDSVPVETGENDYAAHVTVTFAIRP